MVFGDALDFNTELAMVDRISRQQKAFAEALRCCRAWGLNWRTNIEPRVEGNEITGYHILDETRSTTVKTITL